MDEIEWEALEVAVKGPMGATADPAVAAALRRLESEGFVANVRSNAAAWYELSDRGREALLKAKRWMVDEGVGELYFRYFEVRNPETPVVVYVEMPWDDEGHEEEDRRLKEWAERLAKHLESMPLPATWQDKS